MTDPAELACGGWIAASVGSAARLGIADLLADGPRAVSELAAATASAAPVLERVMRVLSALGLFREMDDGRFGNTEGSERLRTDHPSSVRNFCQLAAGEYDRSFDELGYTLATGQPAFHKVFGGSIYEYMARSPAAGEVYDRAMEEIARPVGLVLATTCDLSGVRSVVDVGGGRGTIVTALLAANSQLSATVLDLDGVCARSEDDRRMLAPSLAGRLEFVAGDFFEHVPSGADLYLLKNVLHNWNDSSAAKILNRVVAALDRPGARLLVIEPLRRDQRSGVHSAMDDLMQVVICEAGTTMRTERATCALMRDAGLEVLGVEHLATGHSVIEGALPS